MSNLNTNIDTKPYALEHTSTAEARPESSVTPEDYHLQPSILTPPSRAEDGTALEICRTTTGITSPYYALPLWRKALIVFITSWTTMSACFASTSLMSVTSEIAASLHTSSSAIVYSNAGVLFAMGCSSFIWAPIGRLIGRKNAFLAATAVIAVFSIATGFARSFEVFVAMRVLGGLQGTYFHVAGQSMLADIFEPVQRGRATGCFLSGTVIGPALGPCIAGIMVTFTSWRSILWLQTCMMGLGFILAIFFLPNINRAAVVEEKSSKPVLTRVLKEFDFTKVFRPMIYPNVILAHLSCGMLSWSQYSLLTAPSHLINPRFHLTTPLVSGLFYLSPLVGFLLGTFAGGKYSDMTVKKWIEIRGMRLPQDRLNAGMTAFFGIIPIAFLVYGWGLQYNVGGLSLPLVSAFFCAAGLLVAFASLNTYCAEVLPKKRAEVIAGKYLVQYSFSAAGSACIVPLIDAIGIGLATTIGVILVLVAGCLTLVTAKYGFTMQLWVDGKRRGTVAEDKVPC